jgi:phage-related protein
MAGKEKPLEWIGSSHRDLMTLPTDVRRFFGYALSLAQAGDQHDSAKVLHGFGSAGLLEVVEDDAGGTYRAVYTVKFKEAVFVLCAFPEEEQARDRHAKRGHRHHSRPAESRGGACKGSAK